jgi:hypothetical protein
MAVARERVEERARKERRGKSFIATLSFLRWCGCKECAVVDGECAKSTEGVEVSESDEERERKRKGKRSTRSSRTTATTRRGKTLSRLGCSNTDLQMSLELQRKKVLQQEEESGEDEKRGEAEKAITELISQRE